MNVSIRTQGRRAFRLLRAALRSRAAERARERLDGSCAAILTYHRVLPAERARALAVEPGMFVTPETFARHLDWLQGAFRVLPLLEIVEHLTTDRALPERACAISFDDGWKDNFDFAHPELARRGMPATIFLVASRVGTPGAFWPDEVCRRLASLHPRERRSVVERTGVRGRGDPTQDLLAALKELDPSEREERLALLRGATTLGARPERELLDWDEVERMASDGVAFESHGMDHAILPRLSGPSLERELSESLRLLRERGHARGALFAYPSGAFDRRLREQVAAAGYRAAFTTRRGLAAQGGDLLTLPRLGLHEDVSRTRIEWSDRVPGDALALR